MGSKASKTGAQIVVESLEKHGVQYVFGIPGAKIDKVFDTLVDSSIRIVVCRHEQNAAFIAGGIGRLTGKAGVAIATSGPGVSNLTTGLATANSEGDPLVALGTAPLDDSVFRSAVFEQLGESTLEGAVTTDICCKREAHARSPLALRRNFKLPPGLVQPSAPASQAMLTRFSHQLRTA